jgi:hypothetical protein
MPSPLGSFLLTLSTESQYGVDSGEASIRVVVSEDNAKIMRRASCASFSSSNDCDPDVLAATNVVRKGEIKPTNWDRLCSPISDKRAVQHTLSLPRRKLSNDNIVFMAKKQRAARRPPQSKSRTNQKGNDSLRREDHLPGLRRSKHASTTSTKNTAFSISQKGKLNPFTDIFTSPSKATYLNTPLECPQRKPSVDNMLSLMKHRTSLRTPSNQGNASFDNESLKRNDRRALLNPFTTLVEPLTKEESINEETVTIEQNPMPVSPLASPKPNPLPLKSALKTCSTRNHTSKSVTIISLTDHLRRSNPESVNPFDVMMSFQRREHHHQQDPFCKNGRARRLAVTVETLQKCIDIRDRSSYTGGLIRSLNGKAA